MTTEPSSRFVDASLQRASEALRGSRILLRDGELVGAVSRAYYCVFHAAEAALYSKGISARSHAGVRALFGEHLVKTGIMDKESANTLRNAFDARQLGDYEVYAVFDTGEVETLVQRAELFLDAVVGVLKHHPETPPAA